MGTITYINWTTLNKNEHYLDIVQENGEFIYKELNQWIWRKSKAKYSDTTPNPFSLFVWED